MPQATILRGFSYSDDGIHIQWLEPGSRHDIKAEYIPGLREAGLVTQPRVVMPASEIVQPEPVSGVTPFRRARARGDANGGG